MKLFLTSKAVNVLDKIASMLEKKPGDLKVIFIPNAGDPYGDNKPWVEADRNKLIELGFNVKDFDLREKTEKDTRKALLNTDVIFVAGGNAFYLLQKIRESGFDKVIQELISSNKIYIGSSAGSYVACPTIEAANWKQRDKNIVGLKDLTALNLVTFLVLAHYTNELEPLISQEIARTKFKVKILTNNDFVLVEDGISKLIKT
jgi:dipeptidase E